MESCVTVTRACQSGRDGPPVDGEPMPKIKIEAELSDTLFRAYEAEARRQGVKMEVLVEQTVKCLLKELEREEEDHEITMV